jgi:signal transduction histidine kinase
VSVEGLFDQLSDTHRTDIYRIVQEALTNCAKHAHAHRISVSLLEQNGHIELTVSDDGGGFAQERRARGGLGLVGMEERARELGGVISVRSAPGQGTTIQVRIPL